MSLSLFSWHVTCDSHGRKRRNIWVSRELDFDISVKIERVDNLLELIWKDVQSVMGQLKELQIIVKPCGSDDIIDILTNESVFSDIQRAYGKYIFNPAEVLTHRSLLSYKIKKILERKGVLWSGDPMDVNVTRILMQVREHVARQSSDLIHEQPMSLPDVSPCADKMIMHE
jgi:hypothetical protein